jgi:hypothetical protein
MNKLDWKIFIALHGESVLWLIITPIIFVTTIILALKYPLFGSIGASLLIPMQILRVWQIKQKRKEQRKNMQ